IGNIIRALDGALAPIACASKTDYLPCDDCDEDECELRHMMLDVREAIASVLDHRTLADSRAMDIASLSESASGWRPVRKRIVQPRPAFRHKVFFLKETLVQFIDERIFPHRIDADEYNLLTPVAPDFMEIRFHGALPFGFLRPVLPG